MTAKLTLQALIVFCLCITHSEAQQPGDTRTNGVALSTYESFYFSDEGETITIHGYQSGGDLIIPNSINGKPVTKIKSGAFSPSQVIQYREVQRWMTSKTGYYWEYDSYVATSNSGDPVTYTEIPSSVAQIEDNAFVNCFTLTNVSLPVKFTAQITRIGLTGQVATDTLVHMLANNEAFIAAVASKIKTTSGNYGISTQSGVSNTINLLATKAELANSLSQSRTDGINSVLSNPNLWTLYTTNQIKAMSIGDLVLTRTNNGEFVLNYYIEQSDDLANWYPYQNFFMPLTNLPTDKAFVRIRAKQ
ncbi:MAG: hypothetical protein EBZ61_11260 [Micrococcales bacterium]|nr:hypothetical protein [Micrococcales bacterium]